MANWLYDEGHGGTDPGATYNGRKEKDDVLRMVKRVKEIMEENGEIVKLTRGADKTLSLAERTNIENIRKYDYFVSFHRNAFEAEKAKGVETYSISTTGKGRELAEKVQAELVNYFVDRKCKTANFYVLKNTKCPAILIEIGFIDNSVDNQIFDSRFEEIARSIAKACLKQVGKTIIDKPPVIGGNILYRVVVGTFASRDNANTQITKLKAAGFDSFLMAYEGKFRVICGTFSNKDNAIERQNKLKVAGFDSFIAIYST